MQFFCLDIGGTSSRGALFGDDGTILARAEGAGGALSLGAAQAETAIRALWQDICQTLGPDVPDPQNTQIFAGIAGYSLPGRADDLGARLSDFSHTEFFGDGYGALLAATKGKPGVLISVGTGVAALRLDAAGRTMLLSGWGFPAGDLGSGMWLGLQLTGILTKYFDGVILSPPLPDTLVAGALKIIGDDANQIMAWQATSKPRAYASLAPLIVDHAATGDPFCQHMLARAAREIVDLAQALYQGETGMVHLAGGLGAVLCPYCREIAPEFVWQIDTIDPVAGIYLVASGQVGRETLQPRPGLAAILAKG